MYHTLHRQNIHVKALCYKNINTFNFNFGIAYSKWNPIGGFNRLMSNFSLVFGSLRHAHKPQFDITYYLTFGLIIPYYSKSPLNNACIHKRFIQMSVYEKYLARIIVLKINKIPLTYYKFLVNKIIQ